VEVRKGKRMAGGAGKEKDGERVSKERETQGRVGNARETVGSLGKERETVGRLDKEREPKDKVSMKKRRWEF